MPRKYMLQHMNSFNGDFDNQIQCKSATRFIMGIANMLLNGINIEVNELVTQLSLTISQLIYFNVQSCKPTGNILRYRIGNLNFLSDYMGISVFGKT